MKLEVEAFDAGKTYFGVKNAGSKGGFDCGHAVINKFVASSLKQSVRAGNCTAFALLDLDNVGAADQAFLVGFYTLSMAEVACEPLKAKGVTGLPRRVPCTRLIMLGVDQQYRRPHQPGLNCGTRLMKHALGRTRLACEQIGGRGMYLDADPDALDFYLALGFEPLEAPDPTRPTPMFLFKEMIPAGI